MEMRSREIKTTVKGYAYNERYAVEVFPLHSNEQGAQDQISNVGFDGHGVDVVVVQGIAVGLLHLLLSYVVGYSVGGV